MFRTLLPLVAVAVLVGTPSQAQTPEPQPKPAVLAGKPAVLVNLNTATTAELEQLPGIGAKTAARIIEYRQKKGPFKKIEELMNVQGIGEKSFLKLRLQITVATGAAPTQQ